MWPLAGRLRIGTALWVMPTSDIDYAPHAGRRVAFRTIGCKLNHCETAQMQESFQKDGFRLVDWDEAADVRVINTCTVTAKSDRTCRREIRAAKRLDPACIVAVTGCYAELDPAAVASIPGVDLVVGNKDKLSLHRCFATPYSGRLDDEVDVDSEFISHFHGYTRAFLKIQNGCDSRCSYCIIPTVRGPARSMPATTVLEQIRLLAERGYREVVLTGINLGSWGRDSGEGCLAELLESLLEETTVGRYRLSSIEPLETRGPLLDVIEAAGERVARHFHLPLQSGCDSVLRRMNRPYTSSEYLGVVHDLIGRFPDAALGGDVIVGFPGETEDDFEATRSFVEATPFTYLHVFSYSDRPGTAASLMKDKVHPDVIHRRSEVLRSIGRNKNLSFQSRIAGSLQRALILRERTADDRPIGLTGNYVEVVAAAGGPLTNTFIRGRLHQLRDDMRWEMLDPVMEQW